MKTIDKLFLPLLATGLLAACAATLAASNVPAPLADFGESAEGAYDHSAANDWTKAEADVAELKTGLAKLAAEKIGPAAEFTATTTALEKSVKAKDRLSAMTAANELTRLAAEASRSFGPAIPVDVTLLDCVGRDVENAVEKADTARVKTAVTAVRAAWDKARPLVEAQKPKGVKPAAEFSATVAELEKTSGLKQTGTLAKHLLDQVDDLEKVFP
ncbi:MAG: hypothetical protein WCL04_08735 [Verrucomicrobiota bacterium]